MKNSILVLAVLMLIGLIAATVVQENSGSAALPQLTQPDSKPPNDTASPGQSDRLQPVTSGTISYSLQHDELNITYNKGRDWIKVPIKKENLFNGEYRGNKQELINDSFILTENRAAFLYKQGSVRLNYSLDEGDTWQKSAITESFPAMRFRKVDFLTEEFGYVIISGDRTMSQEYSTAFLTHDGGKTWEATADPPTTRLISDGGFVDETTGFLSYGTINPMEPSVYVTQDGGQSWEIAVFHIPEKYDRVFVQAEVPVKEDDHLSVLLNQGPNGDYLGGKVKGKFISKDNGKTWEFSTEVQPNESKPE